MYEKTNKIDRLYRYWRIRTMYGMYIGYAVFYLTRKSLTYATPELMAEAHLSAQQIGWLGTITYLTYGLSKFVSGAISDKANPRYFMSIGLLVTALANLGFGLSSSFTLMSLFWAINGFFQGWGWPACSRFLTHWYAQGERGSWWGLWNTSHNLGGAIAPLVAIACTTYLVSYTSLASWRVMMLVPALIAGVVSLFIFDRLRDVPESLGLPSIEEYKNEVDKEEIAASVAEFKRRSVLENVIKYVLTNPYIWLLAFASVTVYVVRTAFNDWGTLFFSQHGLTSNQAKTCLTFFEMGGFIGSLVVGWASDYFFKGSRGQVNVLFSVGMLVVSAALVYLGSSSYQFGLAALVSAAIGFFVFGPQMMIGVAAAELSHREASGASTGFIGLFSYLGAALAGFPVGLAIDHWGWHGFNLILVASSLISLLLLLPLIYVKRRKITVS